MTTSPLMLDIKVALKREDGRDFAPGHAKTEAIALIDSLLDRELGQVREWPLADGMVAVAPLPMTRRQYSMDDWSVRVQVFYEPKRVPEIIQAMAQARAQIDEDNVFARGSQRLLQWLFPANAQRVLTQERAQRTAEYARGYARAVATLAFARAGQAAEAAINQNGLPA